MTPQSDVETSAPRRPLASKLGVAGAFVSWLLIAWLAVSALGAVAGLGLAIWGMPLLALSVIYRLDARDVAASLPEAQPAGAPVPRASTAPAPGPAYAEPKADHATHAA